MNQNKSKWYITFFFIEFFYWLALASANYLTVYLQGVGLNVVQVGTINTVLSAVAVIASVFGGTVADKIQSSRKALILFLVLTAVFYSLIPISNKIKNIGIILMLVSMVLSRFFRSPTSPLLEKTVIDCCNSTDVVFGKIRTGGTTAYIIMSLVFGFLITESNSEITFYLLSLGLLPCIYLLVKVKNVSHETAASKKLSLKDLPYKQMFSSPYFICYIIFCLMKDIPQMTVTVFQPYLLQEVGSAMGKVGLLQAYRAAFEYPTLLFSDKLEKKFSYKNMILIGTVCYGIQSVLYGRAGSFTDILLATTFSGIASGFLIAASSKYVYELVPASLVSTAQTIVTAISSISSIIGSALATGIIGLFSVRTFYIITGFVMLLAVVFYITSLRIVDRNNISKNQ